MQAGSGFQGPQAVNVNEMLISPLFLNVAVILLFTLPLITMRTYAEEKRSGTIELLLTSPLTDVQIVIGKFLGGLVLYVAMLSVTVVHLGFLFIFGNPEWRPVAHGVPGAAADGRLLPVAGPLHLEPHEEPDHRRHGDLCRLPDVLGHQLVRHVRRSDHAGGPELPVDHRAPERFRQGRDRHQTSRLLRVLHRVQPVPDRAGGRQRTVARIGAMQRIFSILGWVGTAVVFGAVAIRFVRPEWDQYGTQAAWVGLALVVLYTLGQWREIVEYFRRRQARYGAVATIGVLVALAIVVAVNYLASRQNKRWDLTASRQNSLSEQTVKVLQSLTAPVKFTVFDKQTDLERFRGRLD